MSTHQQSPGSSPGLDALVDEMIETRRAIARHQARESQLLSDAVDLAMARRDASSPHARRSSADMSMREISAELGAAMRMSDRTVQVRMGDAITLDTRFPAVFAAWSEGRMDAGHVRAILDAGAGLADDDTLRRFEALVIEIAAETTPALLRSHARAIASQLDPEAAEDRSRRAQDDRQVRVIDLDDGMGRVLADLPAVLAHAIGDRLTQMARAARTDDEVTPAESAANDSEGPHPVCGENLATDSAKRIVTGPGESTETRTIDQIRADIFADLLLAGAPAAHGDGDALSSIAAHVQITVPALALSGDGDGPALLAGYGPVDLATARRLCAGAPGWDRVLSHPLTGAVLAVDRYRPSSDLRRFLAARDERCRFPGCRRPPRRCDADHTIDAARGGQTSESNLANFCRRHHTLKHATDWTVRQLGGGLLQWTSPLGRRYKDRPPAMVRFVPSGLVRDAGQVDHAPPF